MGRLESQLSSVLASREARSIRRRLAPAQAADITNTSSLVDFSSNDYLSLSSSPILRTRFLHSLNTSSQDKLLGAKGSRLLISGGAHAELEDRLAQFFHAPAALLFNSGFDANVSLLASVPQQGDLIIADELVHASMHDGARQSRAIWDQKTHTFQHGSVTSLRRLCNSMVKKYLGLEEGRRSVFVAVESLYSMDGTIAPLPEMVDALEELFPCGNAYLIVDEAHATGIYGPQGRGLVAHFGLENRVFARLHTFGKALAGSGAILLVTPLVRDYLANYARSFIYTTALAHPNLILANTVFDLLEDGTASSLSENLLSLSHHLMQSFLLLLQRHAIPPHILSLPTHLSNTSASISTSFLSPSSCAFSSGSKSGVPLSTPIIPLLTSQPRPLASYLQSLGLDARPITWPTVPMGTERVRICVHAGNTAEEVDKLVGACVGWASRVVEQERVKEWRELNTAPRPEKQVTTNVDMVLARAKL